ncbi:MAG: AAA family ATPase [Betaproteobacteria bacterium]|nr:AAA family ATPase [Betaproteobacteria bacterium]
MRDRDVNLYDYARLVKQFGRVIENTAAVDPIPARVEHELIGDSYRSILSETARIVAHQWREHIEHSSVKGFLFHGGVGIGKTTMAKRLTYEMCRVFGSDGSVDAENEVVLVIVDGSDIARGRYGESEERLAELFEFARDGETHGHGHGAGHGHSHDDDAMRRTVLLFDDVESLFMSRSAGGAKEWHFSQNSVFFHNLDELDTSHTTVVLTTNRYDLLDDAVIDRLVPYQFAPPTLDALVEVAREKARAQHLGAKELALVLKAIQEESGAQSVRDVERLVTRAYIKAIA